MSYAQDFGIHFDDFKDYKEEGRVIEPTSPILGYRIAKEIKDSNSHPQEIFKKLIAANENLKKDLQLSALSYFTVLEPGLDAYCAQKVVSTKDRKNMTTVEHGASIPLQVLRPIQETYLELLSGLLIGQKSGGFITAESIETANRFQNKRYNCPTATKIARIEDKLEKFCLGLGFCKKAKNINSILSSAEAAYPRIQFGINGFTRYVYAELIKSESLSEGLKIVYDLEREWTDQAMAGNVERQLFDYVIQEATIKGLHIKDVFLILAYSMRNMPSLDIEYSHAPLKALEIETYFWAFKDIRSELSKPKYASLIYVGHEFKRQPGFYHYLTAALLGCEARLAGLGHTTSTLMGVMSKVGYKADKLLKAIDKKKYKQGKIKHLKEIMKQQGTWPGIAAGFHAGKYGSLTCKAYMRTLKKEYRADKKEIRRSDNPRRVRRQIKKELKRELKKSYKSVLEQMEIED